MMAMGTSRLEVISGMICARGPSICSTRSTIVVFSRPEGVSVKYPIETRVNLSAIACRISESTWNVASWEHLVESP